MGCCHYYASAFRRRRHYVFGLSVRPSVRSLKYPLLTCTWVRWSTWPTVTILRHCPSVHPSFCPSVRPERFPGICRRTHGGNGLKFYVLMYLDHLQNWLVYGHGLLILSCDQAALQMVFPVRPSVHPSVTPFWLCSHHRIIIKFSGVITNDQSKVHTKGQGQRSKVKVTTQLNRFRTVTPVWIHIWWWNYAYSLTDDVA